MPFRKKHIEFLIKNIILVICKIVDDCIIAVFIKSLHIIVELMPLHGYEVYRTTYEVIFKNAYDVFVNKYHFNIIHRNYKFILMIDDSVFSVFLNDTLPVYVIHTIIFKWNNNLSLRVDSTPFSILLNPSAWCPEAIFCINEWNNGQTAYLLAVQ